MIKIGDNIKKFRLNNNFSNKKLSKISGLSRSYIFELEKGVYENVSINVLCKLCKALKVTPNDLIPIEMWKGEKEDGTVNDSGSS